MDPATFACVIDAAGRVATEATRADVTELREYAALARSITENQKAVKIRDYRAKKKEARKLARQADDPMEQLRLKKEARKWKQRAEGADESSRRTRKKLRVEAEKYLELIEQALRGTQEAEPLFTIR